MSPQVEAALIAGIVSLISLGGTVVVAVIGFRTTRNVTASTLAEQRTRTLNERFAAAASQLGSNTSAICLAGVYAMAGLADDWEENRQTCVDVLCAYLRLPYDDASLQEQLALEASREVRHTLIRVITAHLREGAAVSWQRLNFDFTGVVFDGGDFRGAKFSGDTISFRGAKFSAVDFTFAEFSGGEVRFSGAEFSVEEVDVTRVSFLRAKFSGRLVDFVGARFSGGRVRFNSARFSGDSVSFDGAEFSGSEVIFEAVKFSGGEVSFVGAKFSDGTVNFNGAEFSGGEVSFVGAEFSGGKVSFGSTKFSGDEVRFSYAKFSGSTVSFRFAEFSASAVDFSHPGDWSAPPEFPWKDTPPAGVTLPKTAGQSQA